MHAYTFHQQIFLELLYKKQYCVEQEIGKYKKN